MNFGNYNMMPTGGVYGGMMYHETPKLSMTQGLTKEQLDSLRKNTAFSLEISEEDLWRSFCTHRSADKFAVVPDEEGNLICSLCGTKFKPYDGEVPEARDLVNRVVDLMETTKMQALNLPPNTIKEFFQIEPLLKKLPDLYDRSRSDYKRALGFNENYVYGQENNAFAVYQNMINPMAGNGYMDPAMMQPMYGAQPMQPTYGYAPQPMMQQQPMQQPAYGQPMMQQQPMYGGQPMMQQQPMYGGQPQGNPFNVNSAPVTAPAPVPQTPVAPAQADQVMVNKALTD